jgi:hypothetical protein
MASIQRQMQMSGNVVAQFRPGHGHYRGAAGRWLGLKGLPASTPLRYRVRTAWLELALHARLAAKGFWRGLAKAEGIVGVGRLHVTVYRGDGRIEHLGLVCTKVITDTGVTYLRDDFNNSAQDITNMNFHGAGTGTNAEAAADSALQTESTTALNPDSTRATGTRSTPASNQFRSVGTLTFDADAAITEHGILSQAATGGGVLWDRSKFAAINVVGANGDSIQFTYTLTLSSGG